MMEFFKTADVVVIGGGIVGTAILRELSKYDLKCVLVEKEPDVYKRQAFSSSLCYQ